MKKHTDNLIVKLLIAVVAGILLGLVSNEAVMSVVVVAKHLVGQVIFFTIPLIIIGFIAPSITKLKADASRFLTLSLSLAYGSSVLAAVFSATAGYLLIPRMHVVSAVDGLRELPSMLFELNIDPIMPVMSALVLSVMLGLATSWTKSETMEHLLDEIQKMVLSLVNRIIIPILPVFIGATFAGLSYEGTITKQVPVFLGVILIVMVGHFLWIALLYGLAGAYAGKNPMDVLRHYGPAYLTAVGTMSSAATLPVALTCARKSPILRRDIIDFGIPLFANIHLCGSVLTETFFVMTVSQVLYGRLPSMGSMLLFVVLLGIFAVGAPGVPGGTVMASLGLIVTVLGFDSAGTALMLTIFALQDSFGTACNVTADGALTLILSGYANKKPM